MLAAVDMVLADSIVPVLRWRGELTTPLVMYKQKDCRSWELQIPCHRHLGYSMIFCVLCERMGQSGLPSASGKRLRNWMRSTVYTGHCWRLRLIAIGSSLQEPNILNLHVKDGSLEVHLGTYSTAVVDSETDNSI